MSRFTQEYLSKKASFNIGDLLNQDGVLAVVGYGGGEYEGDGPAGEMPGFIPSGLTGLGDIHCEVIRYPFGRAERGQTNNCQWSLIGDLLCAATQIPASACTDMESATEAAYDRLLNVAITLGYPTPFRIWNMIPRINEGEGDFEVYKQFCAGRTRAFTRHGMTATQYPAASAVGHHGEGATVYLLATTQPSRNLENPLQMPAYTYPREYGPSSPTFARATRIALGEVEFLFISGTASILGHSTQGTEDLVSQLAITQSNIAHLVQLAGGSLAKLSALRVYLRHPEHLPLAQNILLKSLAREPINFVLADICRQELLVEIEALVEL